MNNAQLGRAFTFLRPIALLLTKMKFNFKAQPFDGGEGPYLILSNHIWAFDMMFVGLSFKKPIRFVASEHVFRKGLLSAVVRTFFDPICKRKGTKDIHTVRAILKSLKSGEWVGLYPEGNCSHDGRTLYISPAAGKLVKAAGVDVLLYTTEQGYLASPRWCAHTRKAKLVGSVKQVITKEEVKQLTDEQLTERIRSGLYCDATPLENRNTVPFGSRKLAEYAERAVFVCPHCKGISTIHSSCNRIYCDSCDMHTELSPEGYFQNGNLPFETMWQWDEFQREYISTLPCPPSPQLVCTDEGEEMSLVTDDKTTRLAKGTLKLYTDHLEFQSNGETCIFPLCDITGVAALDKQTLNIVIDAKLYEFKNRKPRSAIKYMYLINYYSQKQRGDFNGLFGI